MNKFIVTLEAYLLKGETTLGSFVLSPESSDLTLQSLIGEDKNRGSAVFTQSLKPGILMLFWSDLSSELTLSLSRRLIGIWLPIASSKLIHILFLLFWPGTYKLD